MDDKKLTALLGSAWLLKKTDDRIDELERKISEILKLQKALNKHFNIR